MQASEAIERVKDAQKTLSNVVTKTPLVYSAFFSGEHGNEVYIKAENLQKTGAFKLRGA